MDDVLRRLAAGLATPVLPAPAVIGDASPAAVLIPLFQLDRAWHILFTRRTDTVESHRGQVSFPGGRIEDDDRDPVHGALREADEEIGLRPVDVRVLGCMAPHATPSGFWVTPVVGVIPWPYLLHPNRIEVATIFGVPLEWMRDPTNREVRDWRHPQTGMMHKVIFFAPYAGEVVWGITARITVDLLSLLDPT